MTAIRLLPGGTDGVGDFNVPRVASFEVAWDCYLGLYRKILGN